MSALLLTSVSAFAFGGGGGGRTRAFYERHGGVDAIGIHRHVDKDEQADIQFTCDDPNATPNMQGVCECNVGYIKTNGVCRPECSSGQGWNGEQCVPINMLYTHANTMDTHYNFTENGPDCPPNYHWANSSEVISDFQCTWNEFGYYDCAYNTETNGAFLSDCVSLVDWKTSIPCDVTSTFAFFVSENTLDMADRTGNTDAWCRHD